MKKFEIFVKLFVVLLVIFCFESYFKGEIIQKTFMDINEYYHLESGPNPFYSVFICESKGNKVNLDCFVVEEVSNQDKNYLIGKMENNQYFYINYSDNNKKKFNLTKEEIEKIFSQKIKLEKSKKYINKYGKDEFNIFDEMLAAKFIKTLLFTPIILMLIKFKIYPKSWNKE